jgi:hypothetical protein
LARLEQDRALEELVKELDMKRDRELRARKEKQEIQKTLQELERTKITALEKEKKRELERLAAEREALRLREDQVMEEIASLEARNEEAERRLREMTVQESQRLHNMEA